MMRAHTTGLCYARYRSTRIFKSVCEIGRRPKSGGTFFANTSPLVSKICLKTDILAEKSCSLFLFFRARDLLLQRIVCLSFKVFSLMRRPRSGRMLGGWLGRL